MILKIGEIFLNFFAKLTTIKQKNENCFRYTLKESVFVIIH